MAGEIRQAKRRIREAVWRRLEERGVARFPRPVYGRIPNFSGAEAAAARLAGLREFEAAEVVKVNPDAPQRPVRLLALQRGRTLVMATPRLKEGFLLLDPSRIPRGSFPEACTITGAFRFGRAVDVWSLPRVDLVVVGSVAVSASGCRLGKGEGYAEIEYAILREAGKVGEKTPILTTVHELQLVEDIPHEEHDVPVDAAVTPDRVIPAGGRPPRPGGILWGRLTEEKISAIPILSELRKKAETGFPVRRETAA